VIAPVGAPSDRPPATPSASDAECPLNRSVSATIAITATSTTIATGAISRAADRRAAVSFGSNIRAFRPSLFVVADQVLGSRF
jgi:hypothetical protein